MNKSVCILSLFLTISPLQASINLFCCSNVAQQVIPINIQSSSHNNDNDNEEKTIIIPRRVLKNALSFTSISSQAILNNARMKALRNSVIIENEDLYQEKKYSELEHEVINQAIRLKIVHKSYFCSLFLQNHNQLEKNYSIYSDSNDDLPESIQRQANKEQAKRSKIDNKYFKKNKKSV